MPFFIGPSDIPRRERLRIGVLTTDVRRFTCLRGAAVALFARATAVLFLRAMFIGVLRVYG